MITAPAPITDPLPMVIPLKIVANAPIQTSFSIIKSPLLTAKFFIFEQLGKELLNVSAERGDVVIQSI